MTVLANPLQQQDQKMLEYTQSLQLLMVSMSLIVVGKCFMNNHFIQQSISKNNLRKFFVFLH